MSLTWNAAKNPLPSQARLYIHWMVQALLEDLGLELQQIPSST